MGIKNFLRKWLGIEKDFEQITHHFRLMGRAINETFDLKKQDKDIFRKIEMMIIEEIEND